MLYSCQFESDELFEDTTKSPPIPPELTVLELSIDQDTLFLTEPVLVKFSFDVGENDIHQVNVIIGEKVFQSFDSGKGEFVLDPKDLNLGYHPMKLSVITNSNSGSIADIVGVEGFEFLSNDWTIFSLNRTNKLIYPTISYNALGEIILHWDSCRYRTIEYTVEKYLESNVGPLIRSNRIDLPYYIDQDFIGEKSFYQIYVSEEEDSTLFPWGFFTLDEDFPVPDFALVQNRFALQWTSTGYSGNLSGFRIRDLDSGSEFVTESGTDTVAFIDIYKFGQHKRFSIIPIPKRLHDIYLDNQASYTSNISCIIGTQIIPLGGMWGGRHFLTKDHRIIYRDNLNVKSYDVGSNSVVDELFTPSPSNPNATYYKLSLSTSRKSFCIAALYQESIFYGEADDLNHHESFMPPTSKWRTDTYVIDDSDEIIITERNTGFWYFYSKSQGAIIDSLHINTTELDSEMSYPEFSADGNYYTYLTESGYMKMFEFDGRNFSKLYEEPVPWSGYIDEIILSSEDPGMLFQFDNQNIYFRRVEDFSLISSYEFATDSDRTIQQVDFKSGHFLLSDRRDNTVSVHKLDDGALIIKVNAISLAEIILAGNSLIYTPGYRLDFLN